MRRALLSFPGLAALTDWPLHGLACSGACVGGGRMRTIMMQVKMISAMLLGVMLPISEVVEMTVATQ